MVPPAQQNKDETLTLRLDPGLKSDFMAAVQSENKPVAEILRELMRSYVHRAKRRKFLAEARRQSHLISRSADEAEVMKWIADVSRDEP